MRNDRRWMRDGIRVRPSTAVAALLAVSTFVAAAANAQQLWTVGEVSRAPERPEAVTAGLTVGAGASGFAGMPVPAEAAEVQVAYDYLRLGMGYLELPLPDGSMIEAENAVFEDRGGGNLMWTGEVPGAGYESVLFTVQDGHLVGWFGEPGGPKYVVYAGPDGRGSLAEEAGPTGDWCGVTSGFGGLTDLADPAARFVGAEPVALARSRSLPGRHEAAASSNPAASDGSEASGHVLEILFLYTTRVEAYWKRHKGGAAVGIQQFSDYLNMVFRNGEIPATASLAARRWAPTFYDLDRQGRHFLLDRYSRPYPFLFLWEFRSDPQVAQLRRRHQPDLVHFVSFASQRFGSGEVAGKGALRGNLRPGVLMGWSEPFPKVFAHEIGHNLGGRHNPESYGEYFAEVQRESFRPHVFGHLDSTSCEKRRGDTRPVCPMTVMSYMDGTPRGARAVQEPLYSSVRHRPNGWTIGREGISEVERLIREVVPVAARSGEESPVRIRELGRIDARWMGRDRVRLRWSEDTPLSGVGLSLEDGGSDWYEVGTDENVTGRTDAAGGLDIAGLRPAGRYRVLLYLGGHAHTIFSLPSPLTARSPAAPSNVGASETGPSSARLTWVDNSSNEAGFEVWGRKWSGKEADNVWRRYGPSLGAGARSVEIAGLTADEWKTVSQRGGRLGSGASIGRYSFVVVAYNSEGFGASETFHLEFNPGPHPRRISRKKSAADCFARPTGLNLRGFEVVACVEMANGARRRAWDYGLDSDQSGLLYFFGRDNAEILVKVLDGCGVNGHHWVFVAPVTDQAFHLSVFGWGPDWVWQYDSERRPQESLGFGDGGNARGRTARTVSDTTAFPCTTAEVAAAKAASAGNGSGPGFASVGGAPLPGGAGGARSLSAGARTDCEPGGRTLTLSGGYTVGICYETADGRVGEARDWGLDSSQSGLMYFFDRNNAEVLIKVLDGCGVNGHRWVFVAPVTDLAFNLVVESPDGQRWTHANRLGRTADAASDVSAFPCTATVAGPWPARGEDRISALPL